MNSTLKRLLFAAILLVTQTTNALPRVASLNLCADSLLLELALPSQIVSVSWLAQDDTLSNYAEQAKRFPSNHGHIEELIPHAPELVFTGANTSAVENALLLRLGFKVIKVLPDRNFKDYENNLKLVGEAIGRPEQAARLIKDFRKSIVKPKVNTNRQLNGLIFQANGYSPGVATLPGEMLTAAGLKNSNANTHTGGSFLSLEELLSMRPDLIVLTSLNNQNPSLADLFLSHPVLSGNRFANHNGASWYPKTLTVQERHLNCGSQFIALAIAQIHRATATLAR